IKRCEQIERFANAHFIRQIRRLQANADSVLQLIFLPIRIKAEHAHITAAAWTQSFEDFDGGGFSGTVGAEQTEHLAGADIEIDSADRLNSTIVFAQLAHANNSAVGRHELFV